MSAPLITVLIPVWNGEAFLREALDSVFSQMGADFEVLVVDDGSSDRTPEILEATGDSRLRVIRNESRMRLAGALNRGMHEARGRYIARMDADDLAMPERFAKQIAFLDAHDTVGVCGTFARTFGEGPRKVLQYPERPDQVRAFALFNTPFAHPSVMFRRDVVARHNLHYRGEFYPTEDMDFWVRFLQHADGANLPEVLLRYRVHGKSMTGADWGDMDRQAAVILADQLRGLGIEMDEAAARFHREIGMARIPVNPSRLEHCEQWLLHLYLRLRTAPGFTEEALRETVRDLWFRNVMQCTALGTRVLKGFAGSQLSELTGVTIKQKAMVAASVMRRAAGL